MDYKALELKLRRIVEKRLREGWSVQPGDAIDVYGCCCVLGAVVADLNSTVRYDLKAADRLGIGHTEAVAIESGFMSWKLWQAEEYPELSAIGARIRRIYVDDNGVVE